MCKLNVTPRSLIQFEVKPSEDRGNSEIQLGIGKVHANTLPAATRKRHEIARERRLVIDPTLGIELVRVDPVRFICMEKV